MARVLTQRTHFTDLGPHVFAHKLTMAHIYNGEVKQKEKSLNAPAFNRPVLLSISKFSKFIMGMTGSACKYKVVNKK